MDIIHSIIDSVPLQIGIVLALLALALDVVSGSAAALLSGTFLGAEFKQWIVSHFFVVLLIILGMVFATACSAAINQLPPAQQTALTAVVGEGLWATVWAALLTYLGTTVKSFLDNLGALVSKDKGPAGVKGTGVK